MKTTSVLLLAIFTLFYFWGCKKDANESGVVINGLTSISLKANSSTDIGLEVRQSRGKQEYVTLTSSNLPNGVMVSFSPESGIPNFNSLMTVSTFSGAESGVKPITINVVGASGATKSYTINLNLNIPCTESMLGNYSLVETLDGVELPPRDVSFYNAGPNYEYLYDGRNYHLMTLDCGLKKVKMSSQSYSSNGYGDISGEGTFTNKSLTIEGYYRPNSSTEFKPFKRVYTRK